MRKDTRFARPSREEIESKLPNSLLEDPQVLGVWNMMVQSDDPSEVARWFRSYRDSPHCSIPIEKLRAMRDTMISSMRDANKEDPSKRVEKRKGTHYPNIGSSWYLEPRTGA
jgi:hypothetical protein